MPGLQVSGWHHSGQRLLRIAPAEMAAPHPDCYLPGPHPDCCLPGLQGDGPTPAPSASPAHTGCPEDDYGSEPPCLACRFQDGAATANNPSAIALAEAARLWPDVPVECLISLGSGAVPVKPREKSMSAYLDTGEPHWLMRLCLVASNTSNKVAGICMCYVWVLSIIPWPALCLNLKLSEPQVMLSTSGVCMCCPALHVAGCLSRQQHIASACK